MTLQRKGTISVVIPAIDEERDIHRALESARQPGVEVIVADGGSADRTRDVATSLGARVVVSPPGKGRQMNLAARDATGEVLLFLHADTVLPGGWIAHVRETLAGDAAAGAFRLGIDGRRFGLRLIEAGANLRSRYLGLPYGDQALFLGTNLFREIGGFPEWPIMEDVALVRMLRRRGPIRLAGAAVSTSARRWDKLGPLRTTLVNQALLAGFLLGVEPGRLAGWYRGGGPPGASSPGWNAAAPEE
jgi:rSAM/selenodomain-associated transferase 2